MKIEITYEVSETERHIYEFEVYSKKERIHVGTMISNRDDAKDVWGDKWFKYVAKEREKEIEACEREFDAWCDETGDYDYDFRYYDPYIEICKKYNPTLSKTKNGKTRYYGCYFGAETPKRVELYGLVPSGEEIDKMIDEAIKEKYLK